ncbi:MAG: AEC family transporter [Desulfobacterales bacterium]|nr:AEC family transporter [Desulfobacterales bacterium]
MYILNTIIPIFTLILLGKAARHRGYITKEFLDPANRLVFYLAIPALVFRAVSKTSLNSQFDALTLGITMAAMLIIFGLSWSIGYINRHRWFSPGSVSQCSFHCNIGYIGLAIAFYFLDETGFARAGIFAGFIMILQNLLAVIVLSFQPAQTSSSGNISKAIMSILTNPPIIAAMAGILFSMTGSTLPMMISNSLDLLGHLALPLALLIIGASLSFEKIRDKLSAVIVITFFKLILLPLTALILYQYFDLPAFRFLPALILIASPTATVTYVMAKEMNGDPELSSAVVSAGTIFSMATFFIWLNIA